MQIELEIIGMTDQAAADRATAAIRDNHGVEAVRVYPGRGRAFVDLARGAIVEHLLESLEGAGFMARPAPRNPDD